MRRRLTVDGDEGIDGISASMAQHTSQQKQPNEPVRRRHAGKVIAALTVFCFVLASGLVLVSTFSSIVSDSTHIDKKNRRKRYYYSESTGLS